MANRRRRGRRIILGYRAIITNALLCGGNRYCRRATDRLIRRINCQRKILSRRPFSRFPDVPRTKRQKTERLW